jgi:hypothetical protein
VVEHGGDERLGSHVAISTLISAAQPSLLIKKKDNERKMVEICFEKKFIVINFCLIFIFYLSTKAYLLQIIFVKTKGY